MNIEIKISKKPVEYTKAITFLEKRLIKLKNHKANELVWILEHQKFIQEALIIKTMKYLIKI